MFRMITISREYGSGGARIAQRLAERLGWRLVDNWLVTEVAKRAKIKEEVAAKCDESVDPWFYRLVKALWKGGYEGVASRVETEAFDSEVMAKVGGEVILEAASLGECVIVGRGSQCLLRDRSDAFHVSIFASRAERLRRLRERVAAGTDIERLMDDMDRRRAQYIDRFFQVHWKDRRLYHLMITSDLGPERVVDAILCASGLTPQNSS
jgi:cytidylate kinase